MSAKIIDGKKIAARIKASVKRDIAALKGAKKGDIRLAVLEIGNCASSKIYLNAQKALADEFGIGYHITSLPASSSERRAEEAIAKLNKDRTVTGIIIHTPTPNHINAKKLFSKVEPDKDAEGLNPVNLGKLIYGDWIVRPCTPSACMALIDSTGIELRGKEAVIVGHSEIVGKPLSLMLLSRMATTTVCHIGTYEKGLLKDHVQRAEILIVSVGKRHLIKGDWISRGAVVIDVGINRYRGTISGDVEFEKARKKASYITPVPGGVGPVTTVMLMKNLVELYKSAIGVGR